jgi:hypothetical protein
LLAQVLEVEQDDRARVFRQAHQRVFDLLTHDRAEAIELAIAS